MFNTILNQSVQLPLTELITVMKLYKLYHVEHDHVFLPLFSSAMGLIVRCSCLNFSLLCLTLMVTAQVSLTFIETDASNRDYSQSHLLFRLLRNSLLIENLKFHRDYCKIIALIKLF
jgi:hypothetical protein